jgi:hypothetical protein
MHNYEIVCYIIKQSGWDRPKLHIGCHRINEGQARFSEFTSEQMIKRGKAQVGEGGNKTPTDKALSQADNVKLEVVKELFNVTEEQAEFIKDRVRITQNTTTFELLGNQIGEARMNIIHADITQEVIAYYQENTASLPQLVKLNIQERGIIRESVINLVMHEGISVEEAFNLELAKLT